jgi:nicotinate-nucleotide pyrophosphorylase (carboxylating)
MNFRRETLAALREDRAWNDATVRAFVPPRLRARAVVRAKRPGVVAGAAAAAEAFRLRDRRCRARVLRRDGRRVRPGQTVLEVRGPLGAILSAERTALNLLTHLSGVATLTRSFVDRARGAVRRTGAAPRGGRLQVLDTRKTLPGLRRLQRWAVACGGGVNHRNDLSAAVLIKENHLDALPKGEAGLAAFFRRMKALKRRGAAVEMECRNRREAALGAMAGADILLLDNVPPRALKRTADWVKGFCRARGLRAPLLEVSGGVTLETIGAVARAGVDRVSVGRLTHSAPALDMSLDVREVR